MLRDSRGARGGPASNPLQNSNCWPRYVCAELQAYPQKSGNHHVVPAVAIINWESYMFVLSRQGGSVGSATATDDVPPMWQHTQICAQQRLRAGSWMWQSSGPTGQQRGNAQDSHHISTQLPVTTHPHRLVGSPQKLIEISSIGGMTGPQQIGVPQFLDPQQSHKTFMSGFKAPTVFTGIPASNKQHPQQGLVQASLPFKLERHPMSRATSPGPGVKHRDQVTMADRPIGAP